VGALERYFGIDQTYAIRSVGPILVVKPKFTTEDALRSLAGSHNGPTRRLRCRADRQIVGGLLSPTNVEFEVSLTSLQRVMVAREEGGTQPYPDWRVHGLIEHKNREPAAAVGYIRTERVAGKPDLLLIVSADSVYWLSIVAGWTGEKAALLRYLVRQTTRGFAKVLGITDRMVSKWESNGGIMKPRASSCDKLDRLFLQLPEPEREAFWRVLQHAKTSGMTLIAAAHELYPGYRR